jgi:hypothetical protein
VGALSSRPLTACANLTPAGTSDVYATMLTYIWNDTDGGYAIYGAPKGHISAHLESQKIPQGENVGMIDSHVEWRHFNQMINRTGGSPNFYY